jgi:hypothetical protein
MFYGCKCGVVDKYKFLMTSAEMRFFWLPLSIIKCNRVPFTHICEWKMRSPSSGFYGSSGWIVAVATILVDFTSIICLILLFSKSNSDSWLGSVSLSGALVDCKQTLSDLLSSVVGRGIYV